MRLTPRAGRRSGEGGTHTLARHTAATPYAVTVAYRPLDKPFHTVDFATQATLLLGTIANLDRVEVTSGTDRNVPTSEEAGHKLGFDVTELGRDEAKLTAYLRSLGDPRRTGIRPAARTGTLNTRFRGECA